MPKKRRAKASAENKYGEFSGEPLTEWVGDAPEPNRQMVLRADFWYDDPNRRRWWARAGRTVDGASIPRALWTIVGSPYTGCYRKASVVHDIACEDAGSPAERKAADKMYYPACRRGGCSKAVAIVQYLGVRIGAWIPNVAMWRTAEAAGRSKSDQLLRLAADHSIVGTFYEILYDIGDLDDADIDVVDEIVDRHLEAKADNRTPLRKRR